MINCTLYEIDYTMHKEHRDLLMQRFGKHDGAIILDGGQELSVYDTDTCHAFRQESFFQYLFGVREPGCRGFIDLKNKQSVLLVPQHSDEWELWCGKRASFETLQRHYGVDAVLFIEHTCDVLRDREITQLYRLCGVNSDSGLTTLTTTEFQGMDKFAVEDSLLYNVLVECRVIKTEKELSLLRFINKLSSEAHIHVMRTIKPGLYEFHAESEFLHYCYTNGGARLHAYTCICGSGHNAATLHYGHAGAPNDKKLGASELFLNDMGCSYHGYASDITCTFPTNGVFTRDQRDIYEGVLHAHDAVVAAMKPGVDWTDMHLLSHTVLTQHLLQIGLFQGGSVDELMQHEVSAYFYPHGLGHLMGLDVHDVGGYPVGTERSDARMLRKLRCRRLLKENMVLTVEPGCYFIDAQIEECLGNSNTARFINVDVLKRFRGSGGVRIESDVIVLSDGAENMTKVPRSVQDIEAVMMTMTMMKAS